MLALYRNIDRDTLWVLMRSFYEKVVEDDRLAPFFIGELGEDIEDEEWDEHIDLLADFWLAKILGHDTYYGNFIGAHAKMPHIRRADYDRWLILFAQTADEVYTPEIASVFKKKGKQFVAQFLTSTKKI